MSSLSCRCHVAVIGAGAAGLVAARELIREGHDTVVFEQETRVGGTWIYTPVTESDLTGHDPAQNVVHSSVYESLRTNLPRELMGFRDFPFTAVEGSRDSRRFPGHEEVLRYLERFAAEFGLHEVIRFGKKVERAREYEDGRWRVAWRDVQDAAEAEEEAFDAVVVCSGHFSVPRPAEITGIELYRGKQIHSHNYRTPQQFLDQVVVLIGSSVSAMDISRDILRFAKEVHITCRAADIAPLGKQPSHHNLWVHPMIESIREDGSILFLDGNSVHADIILHCTGYKYHFPFLEMEGAVPVTVDEDRVGPLYKHVFPPAYAPCLSFVGIIQKVVPFVQFEIQSKWIAGAISGRIALPSQEDMNVDIKEFYARLEAKGVPKWHTHSIYFNSEDQFEYYDGLARECGCEPIEEWRKRMWAKQVIIARNPSRLSEHHTFHDEFNDDDRELVADAYEEFGHNMYRLEGIDTWPGKQMNSHNYRKPEPFRNQAVVLIGSSVSAVDISPDIIAAVASEVHVTSRCPEAGSLGKLPGYDNMWIHPMIDCGCEDGTVVFLDGNSVQADGIMHCTGYKYHFPFLEADGIVTVDENRVGPLYKLVFPPLLAPWLSFVRLPWKVIPFPQSEYQSKWIAGALSGRISLPSQEKMLEDVEGFYSELKAAGVPKRYTHNMANIRFDYNDWLAREIRCAPTEEWRKQMYKACSISKRRRPETWDDHGLIAEAYKDFGKYTSNQ